MELSLSEDQRLVQDAFAGFFRKELPADRVRAAEATGFDAELWQSLLAMGAPLMRVPESAGGSGASLLDAVLVAEEAGRYLAPTPLIENMIAARVLAELGYTDWVESIGNGERRVTLLPQPATSGQTVVVPGLCASDALLAVVDDRLVLLELGSAIATMPNLGSQPIAGFTLHSNGQVLGENPSALAVFESAIEEWKLLNAAMIVGAAQRALEIAAEYANEREAFGRPIGSYQGLAHPLADSASEVQGAQLLIRYAVTAIANGDEQAASLLSQAWWWATEMGPRAAHRALRTLGGYGLAMEYDAQLYLRRIKSWSLLNGDPDRELLRVSRRLLADESVALPPTGDVGIDFSLGDEAEQFAAQTSAFFQQQLTPELRQKAHHSTSGHDPGIHKKLAQAGLIYADWPEAFGGRSCSRYEIYASRLAFEETPWTFFMVATTSMVASVIQMFGSERARSELLAKIKSGDIICSLGFSEPACGSDVFAAKTTAVRDGDDWLINGQKMFTTGAHLADYCLMLTRTDPEAKKHAGLSLFLLPLRDGEVQAEGVEVHKVDTLMSERTNITYYQDVRVPDYLRLGEVNAGAAVMGRALEIEQGGTDFQASQVQMLKQAAQWAQTDGEAGRPIDNDHIAAGLGRIISRASVGEVLVRRNLWASQEKIPNKAWGPMSKLFATEAYMQNSWELSELIGPAALLQGKDLLGAIEQHHRRAYGTTIYAGTSEVHRSMIAEQVLGLPKSRGG